MSDSDLPEFDLECTFCGQSIDGSMCILTRCINILSPVSDGTFVIDTFDAVCAEFYCSPVCWDVARMDLSLAWKLQAMFPGYEAAGECSRCGAGIDRTQPHVAYIFTKERSLGDISYEDCFVILCPECASVCETTSILVEEA